MTSLRSGGDTGNDLEFYSHPTSPPFKGNAVKKHSLAHTCLLSSLLILPREAFLHDSKWFPINWWRKYSQKLGLLPCSNITFSQTQTQCPNLGTVHKFIGFLKQYQRINHSLVKAMVIIISLPNQRKLRNGWTQVLYSINEVNLPLVPFSSQSHSEFQSSHSGRIWEKSYMQKTFCPWAFLPVIWRALLMKSL